MTLLFCVLYMYVYVCFSGRFAILYHIFGIMDKTKIQMWHLQYTNHAWWRTAVACLSFYEICNHKKYTFYLCNIYTQATCVGVCCWWSISIEFLHSTWLQLDPDSTWLARDLLSEWRSPQSLPFIAWYQLALWVERNHHLGLILYSYNNYSAQQMSLTVASSDSSDISIYICLNAPYVNRIWCNVIKFFMLLLFNNIGSQKKKDIFVYFMCPTLYPVC